jgi:uncharacterized membrane protein YdbT with pleckstrin-like domain
MSYARKMLQPGEHVLHVGQFHGIVYARSLALLVNGMAVLAVRSTPEGRMVIYAASGLLICLAALNAFMIWFKRVTTELAVTERRIIYKTGFIARSTAEMNVNRVEAVEVEQGILGRLLNFGTVHIRGAGGGIENLTKVAGPLELRSSTTAPAMNR